MGKPSKKGRITGTQRKEINNRTVSSAMDGDIEDVQFARVLRHLGAGHIRVILDNKREGIGKIRTVLSRRGSTPIVADDIVIISGRDFETKATLGPDGTLIEKIERFDVLGVLTRAQASKMEKEGRIPAWFLAGEERKEEGAGELFDYTEATDEEVDIDDI